MTQRPIDWKHSLLDLGQAPGRASGDLVVRADSGFYAHDVVGVSVESELVVGRPSPTSRGGSNCEL